MGYTKSIKPFSFGRSTYQCGMSILIVYRSTPKMWDQCSRFYSKKATSCDCDTCHGTNCSRPRDWSKFGWSFHRDSLGTCVRLDLPLARHTNINHPAKPILRSNSLWEFLTPTFLNYWAVNKLLGINQITACVPTWTLMKGPSHLMSYSLSSSTPEKIFYHKSNQIRFLINSSLRSGLPTIFWYFLVKCQSNTQPSHSCHPCLASEAEISEMVTFRLWDMLKFMVKLYG